MAKTLDEILDEADRAVGQSSPPRPTITAKTLDEILDEADRAVGQSSPPRPTTTAKTLDEILDEADRFVQATRPKKAVEYLLEAPGQIARAVTGAARAVAGALARPGDDGPGPGAGLPGGPTIPSQAEMRETRPGAPGAGVAPPTAPGATTGEPIQTPGPAPTPTWATGATMDERLRGAVGQAREQIQTLRQSRERLAAEVRAIEAESKTLDRLRGRIEQDRQTATTPEQAAALNGRIEQFNRLAREAAQRFRALQEADRAQQLQAARVLSSIPRELVPFLGEGALPALPERLPSTPADIIARAAGGPRASRFDLTPEGVEAAHEAAHEVDRPDKLAARSWLNEWDRAIRRGLARTAETVGSAMQYAATLQGQPDYALSPMTAGQLRTLGAGPVEPGPGGRPTTARPLDRAPGPQEVVDEDVARRELASGRVAPQGGRDYGRLISSYWHRVAEQYPSRYEGRHVIEEPSLLVDPLYLSAGVIEMAPSLAASMIPAAGAARAIEIGGRAFRLTPELIVKLARFGAAVTGGAVGGGLEGMHTYEEVLRRGGSPEDAARAATLMGLAAAGLNALSFSQIFKPAGPGLGGRLKHAGLASLSEAITEALEEPAEALILGDDMLEALLYGGIDVAVPAFITGGLAGLAAGGRGTTGRAKGQPATVADPRLLALDQMLTETEEAARGLDDEARQRLMTETAPPGPVEPVAPPRETPGPSGETIPAPGETPAPAPETAPPVTPPVTPPAPEPAAPGPQLREGQRQGALVPVDPAESARLLEQIDRFTSGADIAALRADILEGERLDDATIDENAPLRAEAERLRDLIDQHLDALPADAPRAELEDRRNVLRGVIDALTPGFAAPRQPTVAPPPTPAPHRPAAPPKPAKTPVAPGPAKPGPVHEQRARALWARLQAGTAGAASPNEELALRLFQAGALRGWQDLPAPMDALAKAIGQLWGARVTSWTPLIDAIVREATGAPGPRLDEVVAQLRAATPTPAPRRTAKPAAPPAPAPALAAATDWKLPRELAGAKPRFGFGRKNYELDFASDLDQAFFIVAQPTPSARDADYIAALRGLYGDVTEDQLRRLGEAVRNRVKILVAGKSDTAPVRITPIMGLPVQRPAAAPAPAPERAPEPEAAPARPEPAPAPEPAATWGANNTLVTQARAEELRKSIREKLRRLHTGLDPTLLAELTELGVHHFEAGARQAAAWSRKMLEDLGEDVRPFLDNLFGMVQTYYEQATRGATQTETPAAAPASDTMPAEEGRTDARPDAEREEVPAGEPGPADQGALEGAPAPDVPGTGAERPARPGGVRGPGADRGGARRPDRAGDGGARGLGGDPGAVGVPPERGGRARPAAGPVAGERPGDVADAQPPQTAGRDYVITAEDRLGEGGPKGKFQANVRAIRLLKEIEAAGRPATPEEQRILVRYVGWGGLPQAFEPYNREWAKEYAELKDLLTEEEYRAARASVNNAHFTSETVIRGAWSALRRLGFRGGLRSLETSAGVGHWFGLTPPDLRGRRTGVELDSITGRILRLLYPESDIRIQGFETVRLPDNFYDAVYSNVPFGDFPVVDTTAHGKRYRERGLDRRIHDYFLAKSIDVLRPGGVAALITSSGTMDKIDARARIYLAERAELLGAIRLPNTAFKQNALTEVTTDLLFFRKRDKPITRAEAEREPWIRTVTRLDLTGGRRFDDYGKPLRPELNAYFDAHPEMVLGRLAMDKLHPDRLGVESDGRDLAQALDEAIARLPEGAMRPAESLATDPATPDTREALYPPAGHTKRHGFAVGEDGGLYVNQGEMRGDRAVLTPVTDLPAQTVERIKGMLRVRDALREVLRVQSETADNAPLRKAQQALGKAYDAFVKRHGYLNSRANVRAFEGDPDGPLLRALEQWDPKTETATKTAIFTERTIPHHERATTARDAGHALLISLNERGRIDWERMAELTGQAPGQLQQDLRGRVYRNPEGSWETAEEYLSGNVREKLRAAEAAATLDPTFQENVEALRAVQPEDIPPSKIGARLGAPWIPLDDLIDFTGQTLGVARARVDLRYNPALGNWEVRVDGRKYARTVEAERTYGTEDVNAVELIEDALNLRVPVVYRQTDDNPPRRYKDAQATLAAQQKQAALKARFQTWLWEEPERADRLARLYNDTFNAWRLRQYDGAHLEFPGMALEWRTKLRPHQKNAIWRTLQGGNTLLAHIVGAGKTAVMIGSAMEARRLGLAKKPMLLVPNHMVEQATRDFLSMYPGATVLAVRAQDMEKGRRQEFMSRIATGTWDAIIAPHSSFTRLPVSDETWNAHLQEQIDVLRDYLDQLQQERAERSRVKQMEAAIKRLEAKLRVRKEAGPRDDTITWEELGVDMLFVDEAHYFKNLFFPTKMQRLKGLATSESNRAFDLFAKVQWLGRLNGYRGVVFSTGTPVSNTMAEAYTMMRYLMYPRLRELGFAHFDAWAATFGETVVAPERTPDGAFRMQTRFARFTNLPELRTLFGAVADVQMDREKLGIPVPAVKGGQAEAIISPLSPAQMRYTAALQARVAQIRTGRVDPHDDNMLKVTSDGRKNGLDARLVYPDFATWLKGQRDHEGRPIPVDRLTAAQRESLRRQYEEAKPGDWPESKVNRLVAKVTEIYRRSQRIETPGGVVERGTQLIFLDLATPKTGTAAPAKATGEEERTETGDAMVAETEDEVRAREGVYGEIKRKLIAAGVPAREIAFIHDAKTQADKQALFDDVNEGRVRILLGSTDKMGVGTNVQRRVVALHHMDAPWRPADIEQREGRAIRQGNLMPEVEIYQYLAQGDAALGSFDSYLWQIIASKARFIQQFMRGDATVREAEDIDLSVTATQMMALASGDPRILERVNIEQEILTLDAVRANWQDSQLSMRRELATLPMALDAERARLVAFERDQETARANPGVDLTLGERHYTDRAEADEALKAAVADLEEVATTYAQAVQDSVDGLKSKAVRAAAEETKARALDRIRELMEPVLRPERDGVDHYRRPLGTYRGFTLDATWRSYSGLQGRLTGAREHDTGKVSIASLEARLRGLEGDIANARSHVQTLERRQRKLEAELDKPFESEARYQELLARRARLDEELGVNRADDHQHAPDDDGDAVSMMSARAEEPGAEEPAGPSGIDPDAIGAFMRAEGPEGTRAVAEMDPRLLKVLAGNLYKGNLSDIAVKEMLQNAVDSVRGLPDPTTGAISVDIDTDKRWISVTDTGPGMPPEVASKEFVDIGGSKKYADASGGFGIAKVAIFANAEEIEVSTVAEVPEAPGEPRRLIDRIRRPGPRKVRTTLRGTGEGWADTTRGLRMETEEVSRATPTGTTVRVRLPANVLAPYAISDRLSDFLAYHRLPFRFTFTMNGDPIPGTGPGLGPRFTFPERPTETVTVDGADIDFYVSAEREPGRVSRIPFSILNQGLPQFDRQEYLQQGARGLPRHVIADIRAHAGPEAPNYPFSPSREDIRSGAVDRALTQYALRLTREAAGEERRLYQRMLEQAPEMRSGLKVVDTTDTLDAALVAEIAGDPLVDQLMAAVREHFGLLQAGLRPFRGAYARVNFHGVGLGGDYLGVNIKGSIVYGSPAPEAPTWTRLAADDAVPNLILLNPFSIAEEVEREVAAGKIERAEAPDRFAELVTATVIHELSHQEGRGHDEEFAGALTRNNGRTIRQQALVVDELGRMAGANDGALYRRILDWQARLAPLLSGRADVLRKISAGLAAEGDGPAGPPSPPDRGQGGRARRRAPVRGRGAGEAPGLAPGPALGGGRPDVAAERGSIRAEEGPRDAEQAQEADYARRPDADAHTDALGQEALRDAEGAEAVSRGRGALGERQRGADPAGARTLGLGITAELRRAGRVDLRGRSARTPTEVARLARVYRDPRFETFRIFYTKGGRIVAHEGVTSRMPSSAALWLSTSRETLDVIARARFGRGFAELNDYQQHLVDEAANAPRWFEAMRARMRRLGADGYWLLHNHPSGDPTASQADRNLTKRFAEQVPGLRGHVVINHERYSIIRADGTAEIVPLRVPVRDPLRTPAIPHHSLGVRIGDQNDVAAIGQGLQRPGWVVILYPDAKLMVRAIQEVPAGLFRNPDAMAAFLRGQQRAFGAAHAIAYAEAAGHEIDRAGVDLFRRGSLRDFVVGTGLRTRSAHARESRMLDREAPVRARRVDEPLAEYAPQRQGPRAIFPEAEARAFAARLEGEGMETEVRPVGAGRFRVWARPRAQAVLFPEEPAVLPPGQNVPVAVPATPPTPAIPPTLEGVETDDRAYAPPGKRWTTDPGAVPGEPAYFLDGETVDDARAAIIERQIEGRGVTVFEAVLPGGDSLGLYNTITEAARAAEARLPAPATPAPPPRRQRARETEASRPRTTEPLVGPPTQSDSPALPDYRRPRTEAEHRDVADKRRLIRLLEGVFDVPIRTGKVTVPGARGIFKVKPEVIRLRRASALGVAAHELGHYLKKRGLLDPVGYEDALAELGKDLVGDPLNEGLAEFLRLYVEAPQDLDARGLGGLVERFEATMRGAWPDGLAALLDVRERYALWRQQPVLGRINSTIDRSTKVRGWHWLLQRVPGLGEEARFREWAHRFYTVVFDDLHPIKLLEQAAARGERLSADKSAYILARLTRGEGGRTETFLTRGPINFHTLEIRTDVPSFGAILGKRRVVRPAGPAGPELTAPPVWEQREAFESYLVAKRALELAGSDEARLRGAGDMLLSQWNTTPEELDGAVSQVEQAHPEFVEAADELYRWNDALLDYIAASGRYAPDTIATIRRLHQHYVPLFRVFEEHPDDIAAPGGANRFADLPSPIRRLKGSERRIVSPLEGMVRNAYAIIAVADRNEVGNALLDLIEQTEGHGKLMERIPPRMAPVKFSLSEVGQEIRAALAEAGIAEALTDADLERLATIFRPVAAQREPNVLTLYRDGQPQRYLVDPWIYRAMMNLDRIQMGWISRLLALPAKVFRAGVVLSPVFQLRNFFRDQLTVAIQGRGIPFLGYTQGLLDALGRGDMKDRWRAAGGAIFSTLAMDRPHLEQTLEEVMAGKRKLVGLVDVRHPVELGRTWLRVLGDLTELSEAPTRIGVFRRELTAPPREPRWLRRFRRGAVERFEQHRADLASERPERARALRAAFEAREASLDFRRGGAIRAWTQTVGFMGPWLQGLDKMARVHKDHPFKMALVAALMIVNELLWHDWNRDQECYQNVPGWQRDLFFIVALPGPDGWCLRLPGPFEYKVLYSAIPRRIFEWLEEEDPDGFDRLLDTVRRGFDHNVIPTAVLPILENAMNWDTFGERPIVPRGLETVAPAEQFTPHTSEAAKRVGRLLDVAPAKVDHLIRGYTGTVGSALTRALDDLLAEHDFGERPTRTLADYPIVGAFVSRNPNLNAEPVRRFYEMLDRGLTAQRTRDKLRREQRLTEDWEREHAWELSLVSSFEAEARRFSDWRKELVAIDRDPTLPGEVKRQQIDAISRDIIQRADEKVRGALEERRLLESVRGGR